VPVWNAARNASFPANAFSICISENPDEFQSQHMKLRHTVLQTAIPGAVAFLAATIFARAIESPLYETKETDGKFELRIYKTIPVARAPMPAMKERDKSFRRLFRYISGGNDANAKIPMTAPVFMSEGETDHAEKQGNMSFMIPAAVAKAGAPAPNDGDLRIGAIQGGTFAVLRFSGWKDDKKQTQAATDLARWIAKKGLSPEGKAFFAFYDPPWTFEMFRRNEIWQRVKKL